MFAEPSAALAFSHRGLLGLPGAAPKSVTMPTPDGAGYGNGCTAPGLFPVRIASAVDGSWFTKVGASAGRSSVNERVVNSPRSVCAGSVRQPCGVLNFGSAINWNGPGPGLPRRVVAGLFTATTSA